MFYNPAGIEIKAPPRLLPNTAHRLREVNYQTPQRQCGIHYWLEDQKGKALTVTAASSGNDIYTLYVRASCNGFLTVWDVTGEGRELTPQEYPPWSGFRLYDGIFRVPGSFQFSRKEQPQRIIVVFAPSQTEVAGSAADARQRLVDMPKWMEIVSESEESVAGEVGTYVVNRKNAGVPAEIVFRSR